MGPDQPVVLPHNSPIPSHDNCGRYRLSTRQDSPPTPVSGRGNLVGSPKSYPVSGTDTGFPRWSPPQCSFGPTGRTGMVVEENGEGKSQGTVPFDSRYRLDSPCFRVQGCRDEGGRSRSWFRNEYRCPVPDTTSAPVPRRQTVPAPC